MVSPRDSFVDGLWAGDGFRIINYDGTRLPKQCMLTLCAGCISVFSGSKVSASKREGKIIPGDEDLGSARSREEERRSVIK